MENSFLRTEWICIAIVLHNDHVNLQFARCTELKDPAKILEGTGKKIRHVNIYDSDLINTATQKFDNRSC